MSLKNVIEKIFTVQTDYTHPEHAINQAQSLNALSTDLYTDSKRFIYELIQNADDSAILSKSLDITIALIDGYLIVAHTGKEFDERDVKGICGVNHGTKKNDPQKTGYKGIGFKDVFGKSDYVLIYTKEEYFRFDSDFKPSWKTAWSVNQTKWEEENDRKVVYPWQITPIWTERKEIAKTVINFIESQKCSVATIIRLHNIPEARQAIIELKSQSNMFLFLRNVNKLYFEDETPTTIFLKEDSTTSIKEISTSLGNSTNWLLKRIELNVPQHIKDKLQEQGTNIPEKLRTITKTELIFAAKNKDGEILPLLTNESILYSFLPTDARNYNFPVLINAGFLTNANREQLHLDSPWNKWLFEQIGIEIFKWIAVLIKEKWKYQAYKLLPNKLSLNDHLAQSYNKGFDTAIKDVPFVINSIGETLKVNEVIIDFTLLHKTTYIGDGIIKEFIAENNPGIKLNVNPFMPYTEYGNPIKRLGVKAFEWKDLPKLLSSPSFNQKHNTTNNKLLIQFLHDKAIEVKEEKHITDSNLKDWTFILDHKGKLQKPESIYFPPKGESTWNDPESELSYIHPDILSWLNGNIVITTWLQNIGVVEKTDLTYLIKTIIPNANSYITNENAISIIQWLFNLYLKEEIGREELSQLNELKLLTKNNLLLPAQECYLSDEYIPRLQLEKNCTKDIFITSSYIIGGSSIKEWRRFFSFMGAKEGIETINFIEKESVTDLLDTNLFSEQYFEEPDKTHKPLVTTFTSDEYSDLQTLFLLNDINNHPLSKIFWQDVIKNIDPVVLNKVATQYWGRNGHAGRSEGDPAESYVVWYKKHIPCIPTTERTIVRSNEAFLNTDNIIEIAGEYLPIFDTDIPYELSSDWRAFFQFKTELSLKDYFTLLDKMSSDRNEKGKVKQENKTRIQLIYECLLSDLTNWSSEEIEFVKQKGKELSLLADDDSFKSTSDLHYFSDGDSGLFQGTFQFIHLTKPNKEHLNMRTLLSYLGVELLQISSFGLAPKNEAIASELYLKLTQIAPYLAKWVVHEKMGIYEQVVYEIERQLTDKTFYEADILELTYGDKILKKVNVYYRDKAIHVTRPWKSGMVMIDLPKKLCSIFDVRSFEKEIDFLLRESLDVINEYFIQEGIEIPEKVKVSDDTIIEVIEEDLNSNSFSQTIDYGKLKEIVSKENLSLLKGAVKDPKVLLLHGIDKQVSPFKGHIYHFTHLENMSSIILGQSLKSRMGAVFKDSASSGAINHTVAEKKDFVRFYFRPKTPTQYYNENLGRNDSLKKLGSIPVCPIPVFIKIPIEQIFAQNEIEWEVSLGNMAKGATEYGNTSEIIERFDFNGVYLEKDNGFHGRYFASSQQEFLIKNQLQLNSLNFKILCQDEGSVKSLTAMLGSGHPLIPKIDIDSTLFYGNNCKVNINESNEFLIASLSDKRTGEMILQYSTAEPVRVEGDINATYEVNEIKTVFSNEEIQLQGDLDKVKFSLYYSFNGQLWLIHTNQKETKYNLAYLSSTFPLLYAKEEASKYEVIDKLKNDPLLKYWYSQPIGGPDKLNLEEHTLQVIHNFEVFFSGKSKLIFKETHFKILLALHDIGKPKAVSEKEKEKQHEYSLGIISTFFNEIQFTSDNLDKFKILINGDPIGRFLDNRYNMPLEESEKIIKAVAEKLGETIKKIWETLVVYYQCDAAGYDSLRTKIFANDATGNLVYSDEKKRLLFSDLVEEKFQILEQAIIK